MFVFVAFASHSITKPLKRGKCCSFDNQSMVVVFRYRGHVNAEFKLDSCISSNDRQVLSGSEDGFIYIWDLVDVCTCDVIIDQFIWSIVCLLNFGTRHNIARRNTRFLFTS